MYRKIRLTDNRTLVVRLDSFPGMAGEPMTVLKLSIKRKPVQLEDVSGLITAEMEAELREIADELGEMNHASAVAWCE